MLAQLVFNGQEIRFVDGKPVANDVAKILGYADTAKTISTKVKPKNKSVASLVTVDGKLREVMVLEEAGIYQLIFSSKLAIAEQFQDWVFEEVLPSIRKTGSYSVIQTPPKRAIAYYSDRLADLKTSLVKPANTWCVIEKCNHLLLEVERLGYAVNQFDLLDGSVGKQWSNYRKDKQWTLDSQKATYRFNDKRGEVIINAYQYAEIGYFSEWLDLNYEVSKLPNYLKEKYKSLVSV